MSKVNIVLVHGWGLNSGIWSDFISFAEQHAPQLQFHLLDLPGYGRQVSEPCSSELADLAISCLEQAPKSAIWLAWSLGGMVSLKAAILDQHKKIKGLYLIGVSPCFVERRDWSYGVALGLFQRFANELSSDYQAALSVFLLLQSGANKDARKLARRAHAAICAFPVPSKQTLQSGIDCLAQTDLRTELACTAELIDIPSTVLVCSLDRVANPQGCRMLASMLGAELLELKTGHAPFLTKPLLVLEGLLKLVERTHEQ